MQIYLEHNEPNVMAIRIVTGDEYIAPPAMWKRTMLNATVLLTMSRLYFTVVRHCKPQYYPDDGPIMEMTCDEDMIIFKLDGQEISRMPYIFDTRNENFDAIVAARCGAVMLTAAEDITGEDTVAF